MTSVKMILVSPIKTFFRALIGIWNYKFLLKRDMKNAYFNISCLNQPQFCI